MSRPAVDQAIAELYRNTPETPQDALAAAIAAALLDWAMTTPGCPSAALDAAERYLGRGTGAA